MWNADNVKNNVFFVRYDTSSIINTSIFIKTKLRNVGRYKWWVVNSIHDVLLSSVDSTWIYCTQNVSVAYAYQISFVRSLPWLRDHRLYHAKESLLFLKFVELETYFTNYSTSRPTWHVCTYLNASLTESWWFQR